MENLINAISVRWSGLTATDISHIDRNIFSFCGDSVCLFKQIFLLINGLFSKLKLRPSFLVYICQTELNK